MLYSGPVDCAIKVLRVQGVGGLMQGSQATIMRETPAFGFYFASYECFKATFERRWGFREQSSSFFAGGLAGGLSWLSIYPFDVVKSVQQVRLRRARRRDGGTYAYVASSRGRTIALAMSDSCSSLARSSVAGFPGPDGPVD